MSEAEAGGVVVLNRLYEILPGSPLPELDTPGASAYAARLRGDTSGALFALRCTSHLSPRSDQAAAIKSVSNPAVMHLLDAGVVDWAGGGRSFVFIYERPIGKRLINSLQDNIVVPREEEANHRYIQPLVIALSELTRAGITHGGLRPTNLFCQEGGTVMLGDCLVAPPSLGQPAMFETVERGMVHPASARGIGTPTDDLFALGVTLLFLLLGRNPLGNMDDETFLRKRIEQGSFATLISGHRFAPAHHELLHGLLVDDPRARWNTDILLAWTSGRRMTSVQADPPRRSTRALQFDGREYWQLRPLALAMSQHVAESVKILKKAEMDRWLRLSINDTSRAEDVAQAIGEGHSSKQGSSVDETMVTRACIALDPTAPLRYKGIAVAPVGIGDMLADVVATGGSVQILAELISQQFPVFWLNLQVDSKLKGDLLSLIQVLDRMGSVIDQSGYGMGVERVLYELNPNLPCQSPMIRHAYAINMTSLLTSMEQLAHDTSQHGREPMDRHLAAFIAVHERRVSDAHYRVLGHSEGSSHRRSISVLSIYAQAQYFHGPNALPNLSRWCLKCCQPAIDRIHHHPTRERLRRQAIVVAEKGQLGALLQALDNDAEEGRDLQGFAMAQKIFTQTKQAIADIDDLLKNPRLIVERVGRPVATFVCVILALLISTFVLVGAFL